MEENLEDYFTQQIELLKQAERRESRKKYRFLFMGAALAVVLILLAFSISDSLIRTSVLATPEPTPTTADQLTQPLEEDPGDATSIPVSSYLEPEPDSLPEAIK